MPNWKKLLTSGSNIQISELTLDAAGVTKASIDTSGNISAGNISSSGELAGRGLAIATNGVNQAVIGTNGDIVSSTGNIEARAGYISSSAALLGTELTLKTAGVHKASIDASGNISAEGKVSSSGAATFPNLNIENNGVSSFNIHGSGATTIGGTVSASGAVTSTAFTAQTNGINALTISTAGALSASSTLAGTALTLATAGVQKASITADGSASFAGGIDTGHSTTASLGYVTASQLIVQGTDEGAAIALYDNSGQLIGAIARCGTGANAHRGRLLLKDNADTKIEFTPIGTSYVMGAFSSSGNIEANSFTQTSNGTTIASISNQGAINANMGLIKHTIGSNKGDVVYFGGTTSMTTGDIYHYKSDGTWEKANCNAAATSDGLLAIALGAASDTNGMLLRGMGTLAAIDGTEAVGDVLYLSEDNTGHANAAAPAGQSDIVRIIGYCLHASNKTVWFNPDNTFIEVA